MQMDWRDKSVFLIWNRKAGNRSRLSSQVRWLKSLIEHAGSLEIHVLSPADNITEIICNALLQRKPDVLLAGGGDGTLHLAARALMTLGDMRLPILGQLPFGSGNDFLRQYQFHFLNERNLQRFLNGHAKPIDVGWCNETPFINGVGFGIAADTGREFARLNRRSAINYLRASLTAIRQHKAMNLRVKIDAAEIEGDYSLLAVGNGAYSGGGFKLTPDSLPDDGLMDVCLVSRCSRCRLIRCLPSSRSGTHASHDVVDFQRFTTLTVHSELPIQAQVDGELLPPEKTWSIRVEPSRLDFLVPIEKRQPCS